MNRFAFPACTALAALLAFGSPARADFASCVAGLRADAAHAGISSATIDRAFSGLQPDAKVLDFQKQQPEFTTPIWDYVAGLVDEERVSDGKAAMAREAHALAHAEQTFGVSRYMVAAIWGVESNFGTEMGARPLVQSLSTLACMGERQSYFRSELMATLKIVDRGDIPAEKLTGSWAGAFGQTQFMPSSYLRLAAAGTDGRRDIVEFGGRRPRLDRPLFPEVRLALRRPMGVRGQIAAKLFRPVRAQGERADVLLGRAGDFPHRRETPRRGRGGAPPARRAERAGLPGDAQLRRRLFV